MEGAAKKASMKSTVASNPLPARFPAPSQSAKSAQSQNEPTVDNSSPYNGLKLLEDYMKTCLPPTLSPSEQAEEKAKHWSTIQASGTPTLLPDLRFHDLVFGR